MIRNAVNGYVSTINAKANVRQKVVSIKTFSLGVNFFFTNCFKLVKIFLWNDYLMRVRSRRQYF